jgi:cytochrome c553
MRHLLAVLSLFVVACNESAPKAHPVVEAGQSSASSAPIVGPPAKKTLGAEELWVKRCVVCHGKEGKGDGPGAAALNPKPRTLTDSAWQKSASDAQIETVIVGGGAAIGKSTGMPANPDLANKPELVKGLVKKVRSLAR